MQLSIGIDLGGTRIKAVALNAAGEIQQQAFLPTNDGDDHSWKRAIKDVVDSWIEKKGRHETVTGISAPGLPGTDGNYIAYMPGRMNGLENFHWSDFLETPVVVLNDAIAALICEAAYGVAKAKKNVVLLTLGTGVGGAILIDGRPYTGAFNRAGHLGHMVIDCNGTEGITGMPGTLEECIGNCSIEGRSAGRFQSTKQLLDAMEAGDKNAEGIWLRSVEHLAIGIASIANILSPEMIIIGGGISEANDNLFVPLNQYLDKYEWRPGNFRTAIVKAQHGEFSGAIGAAAFAKNKFNEIS